MPVRQNAHLDQLIAVIGAERQSSLGEICSVLDELGANLAFIKARKMSKLLVLIVLLESRNKPILETALKKTDKALEKLGYSVIRQPLGTPRKSS